jgi:hypothetical protein
MPEQSAEARVADDLFSRFDRIINLAPFSGKEPIADALMAPDPLAEHLVLGLEKLDLATQLVLSRGSTGRCSSSCCDSWTSTSLLVAKVVGVDSTTLEANAAMKSIVRKKHGRELE